MVKQLIKTTLLCATLTLAACGENVEKKAGEILATARTAYERGDYAEAKAQIDSIKARYPKAFETRKASQRLLMDVELDDQRQTLARLDSALLMEEATLDSMKRHFAFVIDTAYQAEGHYLWPPQTLERNLHRSYLRFQVDERGQMSMTSIYCGSSNIHHVQVKVTAPDGSSALSPSSKDSYETTVMGEKIEKADYPMDDDGGVIAYVAERNAQNLRLEFIGDRTYTTTMLPADRQAAAELLPLQSALALRQQIKARQEAARVKIRFVEEKKKQYATTH
ncbi:MAG: hypothetical protein LBN29_07440 [Mediterranea sp.]|jgi:hypothetical protein|nr:hypothetical protein [Mediterranea sp.]